jgi:hypothetical protein
MRLGCLIVFALMAAAPLLAAETKPIAYNARSGPATDLDRLVHENLGMQYTIVDVDRERTKWVGPRGVSGFGPTAPVYRDDKCVPGTSLVIYVISADGRPMDTFPARTTDSFLDAIAVHLMSERRFVAAQMDGHAVACVAATRFNFRCPAEK